MTTPMPYNLTQQKLQQLLAAARLNRAHNDANADAPLYNWNQPRYFDRKQMETVATFTKSVATAFSSALASLGRSDCTAAAADTTLRFASELLSEFAAQPQFHAAIATDKNELCGFLSISVTSAHELIATLLGDTEPQTQQTFSGLENSLLQDITAALVALIGRTLKQAGGSLLRQKADAVQGNPTLDCNCTADQQLCKITFNVNAQNITAVLHIVLLCSTLEPLVAKTQNAPAATSQQLQETILNHIAPVPLAINTRVASLSLRLSDILALEEGDIVVLDKAVSEPIEIFLCKQPAFQGHLATDAGKYAVIIAEPSLQ